MLNPVVLISNTFFKYTNLEHKNVVPFFVTKAQMHKFIKYGTLNELMETNIQQNYALEKKRS